MKCWVASKIHGVTVTKASVEYYGSVAICPKLMVAAGIEPYEQVTIVNLSTGGRWETYAIPGEEREFTLNGGGARLGVVDDSCVVMTWQYGDEMRPARVVFCDHLNMIAGESVYRP